MRPPLPESEYSDYETLTNMLDISNIKWTQHKVKPVGVKPCTSFTVRTSVPGGYVVEFDFTLTGKLKELSVFEE